MATRAAKMPPFFYINLLLLFLGGFGIIVIRLIQEKKGLS